MRKKKLEIEQNVETPHFVVLSSVSMQGGEINSSPDVAVSFELSTEGCRREEETCSVFNLLFSLELSAREPRLFLLCH